MKLILTVMIFGGYFLFYLRCGSFTNLATTYMYSENIMTIAPKQG